MVERYLKKKYLSFFFFFFQLKAVIRYASFDFACFLNGSLGA